MKRRSFGLGTLSLLLTAMGIAWGFTFNDMCIGDIVLSFIGLKAWSNGNTGIHYTIWYSLIFLIPAFLLGQKYKNHFGATAGKIISATIGTVLILSTFFLTI